MSKSEQTTTTKNMPAEQQELNDWVARTAVYDEVTSEKRDNKKHIDNNDEDEVNEETEADEDDENDKGSSNGNNDDDDHNGGDDVDGDDEDDDKEEKESTATKRKLSDSRDGSSRTNRKGGDNENVPKKMPRYRARKMINGKVSDPGWTNSYDPNKDNEVVKRFNSHGLEVYRRKVGQQGKRRGYIWNHFSDVFGDEQEAFANRRAKCIYCGYSLLAYCDRMRYHLETICDYIPPDIREEVAILNKQHYEEREAKKKRARKDSREDDQEEQDQPVVKSPSLYESTTRLPYAPSATTTTTYSTSSRIKNIDLQGERSKSAKIRSMKAMLPGQPNIGNTQGARMLPGQPNIGNTQGTRMLPGQPDIGNTQGGRMNKRPRQHRQQQQQQQLQQPISVIPFMDDDAPRWVVPMITSVNSNVNSQFVSLSSQLSSLASQLATHTSNVEAQLSNANARISNLELQLAHYQSNSNCTPARAGKPQAASYNRMNSNVRERVNNQNYGNENDEEYYDDDDEEEDENSEEYDNGYYNQDLMIL